MQLVYETERLYLKVLDESYTPYVLDYAVRNNAFLEEWEPQKTEESFTLRYQAERLREEMQAFLNGGLLRFWLFKKEDQTKIIGTICFNNIVRGAFQSCHLGYKLDEAEINKGYITEALQTGIEIAFTDYQLHRIEANIMPKNLRSMRVVEKLGFYNEGRAYKYLKINGKWEDHIHMVLLNEML